MSFSLPQHISSVVFEFSIPSVEKPPSPTHTVYLSTHHADLNSCVIYSEKTFLTFLTLLVWITLLCYILFFSRNIWLICIYIVICVIIWLMYGSLIVWKCHENRDYFGYHWYASKHIGWNIEYTKNMKWMDRRLFEEWLRK